MKIDLKALCKANGYEGAVAVGYNKAEEALLTSSYGRAPLGLVAIEVLAIFFQEAIEQEGDLPEALLAELGATVCTEAFMLAKNRVEQDNE